VPIVADVIAVVTAHAITAWLFTYLLHSTVMISIAWLLERMLRDPALRALAWRTALVGPLLTAGTHIAIPFGSPLRISGEAAGALLGPRPLLALLVVAAWCTIVVVRTLQLVRSERRARTAIGPRNNAADPDNVAWMTRCARAAGLRRTLRLTHSPSIHSPAAFGSREICVPTALFRTLSPAEQHALLAHEIAHHVRRDPLWCGIAIAVAKVCFFQPLNHFAARQLRCTSELAADARALRVTRDPLALARALQALAPHALRSAQLRTAAAGSPILERIRRILDPAALAARPASSVVAAIITACMIGACLALGPGVHFEPDRAANSIPSLTPSRAEPTPQMLELRRFDRDVRDTQRQVERRIDALIGL
jgi:Zn-dependent protease with chaperone function